MRTRRGWCGLLAAALLAPGIVIAGPGFVPAASAATPVANPPIAESCGVDLTVVLDASGSVSSSHAVEDVRNAGEAMIEALSNTSSVARVLQFASISEQLAPSTLVDDVSLSSGGALRDALNGYYNPQPPRPTGTTIHSYDGSGNPLSSSNYNQSNNSIQYTNWDQSLHQAGETTPELVVYVTDGDPTAFDFDQRGDPFDPGPPPDVAIRTDGSSESRQVTNDRSIEEANRVKSGGSRMLAIGVGSALNNSASRDRLVQIAGPQVVGDADLDDIESLNDIDVALVQDFGDLAQFMRSVVLQLCSPSLTIRKLAQSPDDATYAPASGWDVTVTPSVPSGNGFDWILPDPAPAAAKTVPTDANGFAAFQWEPDPPEADSVATIEEDLQAGYTAGRPEDVDYRCELRNEDGDVRVVEEDFANPAAPSFDLDPIGQEIVTCTVYNSFDYEPDIELAKVNAPTAVRGDLRPPAEVTSTYTATNPGNTPLGGVTVTDDRCGLVVAVTANGTNVGDTSPRNEKLDPGEEWLFECTQPVQTSPSRSAAGQRLVNTATVTGTDPAGTTVDDTATDDIDVFTPAIALTKQVEGEDAVTVPPGESVTYTYRATNTGNTPLDSVTLADDTPPCTAPVRGPDDPGNDDAILGLAETWTYSCQAAPTAAVINTATVTGVPLNPAAGNVPFPAPNPPVTATDKAQVDVVNAGIDLRKSVTPEIVLLGPGASPPPESVTYAFTAGNTGDAPLGRPGASTGGPGTKDPGWVTDARCLSPAAYVSGDTDADDLLDPDEVWQFTCGGQVARTTVNVATIEGQPSDDAGDPLPGLDPVQDQAVARVEVARPGINVTKTAVRGKVLDPDAPAISGPDVPTPRQAEYVYQVANTGTVPLTLTPNPPVDDICAPLVFAGGDVANPALLDPDEVWEYTCATTLERQQSNQPPLTGDESGVVRNTVTATGVPFFEGAPRPEKAVTDSDIASVTVIEPSLTLTKTAAPEAVVAGGVVTYTIVVANTGDVDLELIGPTDGKCEPLVLTGGDANRNGLLDGANSAAPESWTYTCNRPIGLPPTPDTVDENTAGVLATDPLGNVYEATARAQVRVIDPAISLKKTPSDTLVPAGSPVSYEFLVKNTGQSPLAADDVLDSVVLRDVSSPANPGCRQPELVAKEGGNQDDLLDRVPAEVWRYTCSATITEPTTNVAGVLALGGSTIGADVRVADVTAAFVDVFHPAMTVEKAARPSVLLGGGPVTYTYAVQNTGDVPLSDVATRVSDDTCSPVTYVSGDTDGDGLLDTATSIFEDSLAETWVFTCTTDVDESTTNTVVVEGTPTDPGGEALCGAAQPQRMRLARALTTCDATDDDTATVEVVEPGTIVVEKRTEPASAQAFPFTLDDEKFSLAHGADRTFEGLAPGTYKLAEQPVIGWDLKSLACVDPDDKTVIDAAAGTAVINLAAGETVTCTYVNVPEPGPPAPPAPPAPPPAAGGDLADTGLSGLDRLIALGVLLLASGSIVVALRRRLERRVGEAA